VGYLVFWLICGDVHLLKIATHPDFHRQGIADRMMAFLLSFSRTHGADWIGLEVRQSNRAARALYRSFGFEERGVRRAYYPDSHEDGILMECELKRASKRVQK
jgi:ribosomal-protein-alanine N-acetyltransferase